MAQPKKDVKHWANRYTFLERIGKGSYGIVYRVKDETPYKSESIKVLKEVSVEFMDKDQLDECTKEAKILSQLNHPNIVKYFDSFSFQENFCIITEYCESGDLNKVIVSTKKEGSHLKEQKIIHWFIQMIEGLNYIHKKRILHRDIKPRNIFIKSDSVKIGDFGISRILNCTMDLASTFLGTPYYMSPEVLKHDGYNTTSDVWSVGVILYEMCSLKHAFDAPSLMDVMVKIMESDCPKIPSSYNEELQDVIERILIKDHCKRPSAKEILDFPCIKRAIRLQRGDLSKSVDLKEASKKDKENSTSDSLSQSMKVERLKNEAVDLTPKQKQQKLKLKKADEAAETQKKLTLETYRENKEKSVEIKRKVSQELLPFTRSRQETPALPILEFDELNSSSNSTIKLSVKEKSNQISRTEEIVNHFEVGKNDLSKTYKIENRKNLYDVVNSSLKVDDRPECKITAYNPADNPQGYESEYSSDFESDVSSNTGSVNYQKTVDPLTNETVPEKFQDNIETDPYGSNVKQKKIETMKKKCLEKIDENLLKEAMLYVAENYKNDYTAGLRKICKSDQIAMMVDQMYFLNNQNKIF